MSDTKKVVFVCTHNAGKSRLAEAYMNKLTGERVVAVSAGTEPSDSANPAAVESAAAAGIELRRGPGIAISEEIVEGADVIVTFGCGLKEFAAKAPVEDWQLLDDQGQPLKDYDQIRDSITRRVDELVERLENRPTNPTGEAPGKRRLDH